MNPSYGWLSITPPTSEMGEKNPIIDIMGSLIDHPSVFKGTIDRLMNKNTTLCISGELKKEGEGQPASNFRFKEDNSVNENVIDNYFYLFQKYHEVTYRKPIIVTTIPRLWRKYTFFIKSNGSIEGDYVVGGEWRGGNIASNIMKFLSGRGVTSSSLIKIRVSCKGSKFNTYLIDMISFLYQLKIGSPEFHTMFGTEYRKPTAIKGGELVGRWTPDADVSYLYYEETHRNDGYVFFVPKMESVDQIYKEFEEAISPYENDVKKNIREHLCNTHIHRWTDFDVNDTDDAFTILMMIHAFSSVNEDGVTLLLSPEEEFIKGELEKCMIPWFSQLVN